MRHHAARRRHARERRGPRRARRRRLRVDVERRARQRHHPRAGPVPRAPTRVDRRLGRAHEQPAVRRDARVRRACRRASPTRARWTSSPRRAGSTRSRSGCATRIAHRRPARHRPGASRAWRRWPRCIRETAALPLPDRPPDDRRCARACPAAPAARPTRGARARAASASRVGDQEPHVLRGLRRLLDGPLPARRRRGHAQVRHRRGRPGLRHDRPADRPRRSSASTRSCSNRPTPRSARPAPRRRQPADVDVGRRGRRGVPGGARAAVRARRGGARRSTRCGS